MKPSKYEIACAIERLPGNTPWGLNSMVSLFCSSFTREELVDKYNSLVAQRGLDLPAMQ